MQNYPPVNNPTQVLRTRAPMITALQPNIPTVSINPFLPCKFICSFKISHPSPGIKQRTRPSSLVQNFPHIHQLPCSKSITSTFVLQPACQLNCTSFVVFLIICNQPFCNPHPIWCRRYSRSDNRCCYPRAHFILMPREGQKRGP